MVTFASITVRPITPHEYAAEARVLRAAYGAGVYADELAGNAEWERVEQDTAGRDRDGRVLVAELDGAIVGAASVLRGGTTYAKLARPGEVELRLVSVDPSAQGRGVGEALVRSAIEEALRMGAGALRLDTGTRNPARFLYDKLGFERTPAEDAKLSDTGYGESLTYVYPLQQRSDVRVREIRPDEHASVGELVLAAYKDDYPQLEGPYLSEIADVAGRAAKHVVWVAEDVASGEVLGTITTPNRGDTLSDVARDGEMDIRLLGVTHRARGRGIGETLTRLGMQLAEIRCVTRLMLNTSTEMESAWRLYEKLGFTRFHEREHGFHRADGAEVWLLAYGYDVRQPAEAQESRSA